MSRKIIKPADDIRKKVKGQGVIEEIALGILLVIEADIERAIENKQDVSITEISTSFDVPPMKPMDAQRAIYYAILHGLRQSGYIPKIEFRGNAKEGNQKVFIHVKWKTSLDETQEQAMDNYIKQHALLDTTTKEKPLNTRRRRP